MSQNKPLLKVIKKVGSSTELSKILRCHKANISRWLHGEVPIPVKYLDILIKLSDGELRKKDLRPDLYKIE